MSEAVVFCRNTNTASVSSVGIVSIVTSVTSVTSDTSDTSGPGPSPKDSTQKRMKA